MLVTLVKLEALVAAIQNSNQRTLRIALKLFQRASKDAISSAVSITPVDWKKFMLSGAVLEAGEIWELIYLRDKIPR